MCAFSSCFHLEVSALSSPQATTVNLTASCRKLIAAFTFSSFVYIPQEVWTGRIAYIIVQFDEDLQTATVN